MKTTLDWLNEYVDLSDQSAAEVSSILTSVGLEVEGVTGGSTVSQDVVVGKVLSAVKHPNADTLRLCNVDIGEPEPLAIVCGAPNARDGIFVAVAKVGATLPGDFKIKKSKIRGETSNGMLCSEKELGISDASEGIIEIPGTPPLGQTVAKVLGLENAVLELNVTPNRGDCLGALGIARDLSAKLKRPLKAPRNDARRDETLKAEAEVKVVIEDPELCARFVALPIKGVSVIPSPRWMQQRLEAAGVRPINLLVDATNYVMLETGQPVHAYDQRFVRGKTLKVRSANDGESLKTLDGQTRALKKGDILICDGEGIIGLAGVMGGESSEVKADTRDIVIEVASFSPRHVRRTVKRLGMHTDASHRFERGTDIDALKLVASRVATLIALGHEAQNAPLPRIAADAADCYPANVSKRVIAMRLSALKQFLGYQQLRQEEIIETLTALGFDHLDSNDDRMVFEVPFGRGDVEREVDLFEEVARIGGFDRIPYQLPTMSIRPTPEDPLIQFGESSRTVLAHLGFRETISFPFSSLEDYASLGIEPGHPLLPSVAIANPLSGLEGQMQTTLIPNLLKAALSNRRRGEASSRLFECGRGYFDFSQRPLDMQRWPTWKALARPARHISPRARQDQGRILERQWIAGLIDQPFQAKAWNSAEVLATFYHAKAAVQGLLKAFGLDGSVSYARIVAADMPHLNPSAAAVIQQGSRLIGCAGELNPRAAETLGFSADKAPVVFELDLEALLDARGKEGRVDTSVPRFPPVTRDVAFQVRTEKTHADFEAAISAFKQKRFLASHRLFDVFEGDKLAAGTKSMAYRFSFQSPERTLTDQEVDQEVGQLLSWLSQSLEALQR